MAASSPALTNTTVTAEAHAGIALHRTDTPPKTLRGLNKPKCIQCGNVARSRCPYQSCKSCCSKAQNPCHIHVLKANATFPDKTPTTSTPVLEQKPTDVSPVGNSHRRESLRQLSSNFAQFNNLQIPLRSRKPLTKKDAAAINEWRFSKVKECRNRDIEVENESFDRYMENISLLEEVFSVKSIMEDSSEDDASVSNPNSTSVKEDMEAIVSRLKLNLRSDPSRSENFRKRIQQTIDQGLEKLRKHEVGDEGNELNDENKLETSSKKVKLWSSESSSALNDIIEKLNKARSEDDSKSYSNLKSQLHSLCPRSDQSETEADDANVSEEKPDSTPTKGPVYSLPKLFTTTEIDQETLNSVDAHFSSLEKIEDL